MSLRPLLIVESPSKAKTIEQYLGGDYDSTRCTAKQKTIYN